MPFLQTPAGLAIAGSMVCAVMSLCAMMVLYARRLVAERHRDSHWEQDRLFARSLIQSLDQTMPMPLMQRPRAKDKERFERVFSHVIQLLSGSDHDRLLSMADQFDLPKLALKALRTRKWVRRIEAISILERFPTEASLQAITERMLNDPKRAVREQAAAALSRLNHPPAPRTLVQVLQLRSRPKTLQHAAMLRSGAPHFAEQIVELAEEEVSLRALMVDALGWSANPTMVDVLRRYASDTNPEVRAAAVRAARHLGVCEIEEWLIPLLQDPTDFVRIQAAQTCAKLQCMDALPILSSLTKHPSWWVRKRANDALAQLRSDHEADGRARNRIQEMRA